MLHLIDRARQELSNGGRIVLIGRGGVELGMDMDYCRMYYYVLPLQLS